MHTQNKGLKGKAGGRGKLGCRQGKGIRGECKAGRPAVQFGGKCYAGQKLGNKCEMDNFTFYNWSA